jgi:hypothetical protein
MASEPGFDRGCFVRPIVVHHQMHIQTGWHARATLKKVNGIGRSIVRCA